jgi:hypothetical protein
MINIICYSRLVKLADYARNNKPGQESKPQFTSSKEFFPVPIVMVMFAGYNLHF